MDGRALRNGLASDPANCTAGSRIVAWLGAAGRTFPVFAAIVVTSALAGFDVSRIALAVTWPTLTVVLLALTDESVGSGEEANASPSSK